MMLRSLLFLAATAAAAPYACEVQHAFGAAAAYTRRSTLTVDPDRANHNKLKFAPDSLPLVGANATAFAELAKADGVYRIRVRREGARRAPRSNPPRSRSPPDRTPGSRRSRTGTRD